MVHDLANLLQQLPSMMECIWQHLQLLPHHIANVSAKRILMIITIPLLVPWPAMMKKKKQEEESCPEEANVTKTTTREEETSAVNQETAKTTQVLASLFCSLQSTITTFIETASLGTCAVDVVVIFVGSDEIKNYDEWQMKNL